MRPLRRTLLLALVVALSALGAASCGDDEGGPTTVGVLEEEPDAYPGDIGQWVVEVEPDPDGDLAFDADEFVTPPGNTNFVLRNPQEENHSLAVETADGEQAGKTIIVSKDVGWLRLTLEAGARYVFYCPVPGHREAGMEGTVTVDEGVEPEGIS